MSHVNWLQWHAEFSRLRSEHGTVSVYWYGRRRFWLGSEHGTRCSVAEPIRLAVHGVWFDPHDIIANLLLFRKKEISTSITTASIQIHVHTRLHSAQKICMYVAPRLPRPLTRSNYICQQLAHAERHVSMSLCAPDSVRVQCAVSPKLCSCKSSKSSFGSSHYMTSWGGTFS
jgi:hypothetical protein